MKWKSKDGGNISWMNFTALTGSSTRSETAAVMLSMLADKAVTIGSDSLSAIINVAKITKHMAMKAGKETESDISSYVTRAVTWGW